MASLTDKEMQPPGSGSREAVFICLKKTPSLWMILPFSFVLWSEPIQKGVSDMKRLFAVIIALLLLVPALALAQSYTDTPPMEVAALAGNPSELADYISFTLPDGSAESFWLERYGYLMGFRCEAGEWSIQSQVFPVDGTWDVQLVRHDPAIMLADGSHYQDALGFDILCKKTGNRLSYHYNGTEFVLCGWENPSAYPGVVMLNGLTASYWPTGSEQPEAVCQLGEYCNSLMMDFADLPYTPVLGQAQAAITEAQAAAAYPGYTLRYYETYNANSEAWACYSRFENGLLHVKRVAFSDAAAPVERDDMPLPLSPALMEKLETEGFDQLLNISGYSSLFRTEDAFDRSLIPVEGRILDSDLHRQGLLLLAEDAQGIRRLHWVTQNGAEYRTQSTHPLPEKAWLDVFHASDGRVIIKWLEADGEEYKECYASYTLMPDGLWHLGAVMHGGRDDAGYSMCYCGPRTEYTVASSNGILIGSLPGSELFSADLAALPTVDQLADALNRTGWAKVNNPDPADRLHLRTQPDLAAASLGKFYNGTPVQALEEKGGWCRVQIGTDGRLVGWMMKKYLAFGSAMDSVDCAFPELVLREVYDGQPMYASAAKEGQTFLDGEMWVAGIAGEDLYVILTPEGGTAYAPVDWFFEGNG